jgi:hypothetical protein
MNKIRNSLISGQIPSVAQMEPGDIGINNADGTIYILRQINGASSVIQLSGLTSFNTRTGAIVLNSGDVIAALGYTPVSPVSPIFTGTPTAPTATPGANTTQLATTAFVSNAISSIVVPTVTTLQSLTDVSVVDGAGIDGQVLSYSASNNAWKAIQLSKVAKTGLYTDLIGEPTALVTSFNTRTGAITLTAPDITGAGGALLASPTFTGIPAAPTATAGTNTTQLATTAFVSAAITAANTGVVSFNTRTGAVVLTAPDISGVGGALLASPTFTGTPTAPTPATSDNSQKLATTAFVNAVVTAATGVVSFNTRTGAITLTASDVNTALGYTAAPLASPTFTGTPAAPTATAGTSTTQVATTAFVASAITANALANPGVATFNTRSGAVVLTADDVTGVGGALLASPTFTGIPVAPTATAGTATTQLATTAFVTSAITANATANPGVTTFNTRNGAVTLTAADINAALGYVPLSPAAKYYDISGGAPGAITTSELIAQNVSGRTVTFPANFAGSNGYAATAPTASCTFTVAVSGVTVGTMVFAAGSHTSTFTTVSGSGFTIVPGNVMTITAPATADATLATVSCVLLGVAA